MTEVRSRERGAAPGASRPADPPPRAHVEVLHLTEALDDALGVLAPRERLRAVRYRRPEDRRRFAARRAFLRRVLGRLLACPPEAVPLVAPPGEKPALADDVAADLTFNASSSRGIAVVAWCRGADLGIDLERLRAVRDLGRLAQRVLADGEHAAWRRRPEAEQSGAFLRAWVRKEASVKAAGVGLRIEPSAVVVPQGAEREPVPVRVARWRGWVRDLDLGPDLAAALASSRRVAIEAPVVESPR